MMLVPQQLQSLPQHPLSIMDRPKSTPGSKRPSTASSTTYSTARSIRPKTAIGLPANCERVYQVEHEPTRKHNLGSHLPVRKGPQPPWQRQLDGGITQTINAPGYILSRSKSKMYMYIKTDDFFTEELREKRDSLISQLQQQIDDLTLYLEEEKLNHRDTKRQADEELQRRLNEVIDEHEEFISKMEDDHKEEIEQASIHHEKEIKDLTYMNEQSTAKLRGEVEFLQGAFESYKSQLHADTDVKWKRHENQIKQAHEEEMEKQLNDLRQRLITERSNEKANLQKEHNSKIHLLKKDHKKEIESLNRKYADAAETVKKLKEAEEKLERLEEDYENLKQNYDSVCLENASTTKALADKVTELAILNSEFQSRVAAVEKSFINEINSLKQQKGELHKKFREKCDELFNEKHKTEEKRIETIKTTKQAMKMLIETRNRAEVSLASGDVDMDESDKQSKQRPMSAPATKQENQEAILTAGETEEYVDRSRSPRAVIRTRPATCRPGVRLHIMNL